MIDSRKVEDLHPTVQEKCKLHRKLCEQAGIQLLITSTYRDIECQNSLYAKGRTAPGKKVTNAKGGQSWHNFQLAYDVVPLQYGKPVWGTTAPADKALWDKVGELGEQAGLEWAGRWKTFKETAHFQYTAGHPLSYFQNGGKL